MPSLRQGNIWPVDAVYVISLTTITGRQRRSQAKLECGYTGILCSSQRTGITGCARSFERSPPGFPLPRLAQAVGAQLLPRRLRRALDGQWPRGTVQLTTRQGSSAGPAIEERRILQVPATVALSTSELGCSD